MFKTVLPSTSIIQVFDSESSSARTAYVKWLAALLTLDQYELTCTVSVKVTSALLHYRTGYYAPLSGCQCIHTNSHSAECAPGHFLTKDTVQLFVHALLVRSCQRTVTMHFLTKSFMAGAIAP